MKDWSQVCPNCRGTGVDPFFMVGWGGKGSCFACEGTGKFEMFAYLLLSGQIVRERVGWEPEWEFYTNAPEL